MSPFGYSLMADSSKFGHTLPLPDSRFAPLLIVAANCLSLRRLELGISRFVGSLVSPLLSRMSLRDGCALLAQEPIAE